MPSFGEEPLACSLLFGNIKIKIQKILISPVVLCECKTWPFILREEHRLRVCDNRVLSKEVGPTRNVVRGEWRKLRIGEICDLYTLLLVFGATAPIRPEPPHSRGF